MAFPIRRIHKIHGGLQWHNRIEWLPSKPQIQRKGMSGSVGPQQRPGVSAINVNVPWLPWSIHYVATADYIRYSLHHDNAFSQTPRFTNFFDFFKCSFVLFLTCTCELANPFLKLPFLGDSGPILSSFLNVLSHTFLLCLISLWILQDFSFFLFFLPNSLRFLSILKYARAIVCLFFLDSVSLAFYNTTCKQLRRHVIS